MTIAAIKKELHQYIDTADEKKLKAIYLLLQEDVTTHPYSKDELEKFYAILDSYENGTTKALPVEIIHRDMRARVSANGKI